MARADWTYELPPGAGDSVWLEEYLVYAADGEPVGKVFAVLEHGGERLLGVEREHLPFRHDRRVVPFDAIRELDHENLAVHLGLAAADLDEALELDPGKGVEQGGEARRVAEVPPGEVPPDADAGAAGPVDRPRIVLAPILFMLGTFALLGVFVFWGISRSSSAWWGFAVTAAFWLAAALVAWRSWARPWRRDAATVRFPRPRPRRTSSGDGR